MRRRSRPPPATGESAGPLLHREARRGSRWTPRTHSPCGPLSIEKLRCGPPAPACTWKRGVQPGVPRGAEGCEPPLRKREQARWNGEVDGPVPRWRELRDDFAAIRHEYAVTRSNLSDVLAQAVLQLTHAYRLHLFNVASCGYIVKPRRPVDHRRRGTDVMAASVIQGRTLTDG